MAVEMKITLEDTGVVNVTGPLEDKILAFGLLEMARLVISQYRSKTGGILRVPPGTKLAEVPRGN